MVSAGTTSCCDPARSGRRTSGQGSSHLVHCRVDAILQLFGEWYVLTHTISQDNDTVRRTNLVDILDEETEGADLEHV